MAPLKELLPPTQETKEEEDLDELKNEKEEEDFDEKLEKGIETTQEKGLFTAQPTLSTLYRPKKDVDSDMYGGADEQLDKILKTQRFKPDKSFAGTSGKTGLRNTPVELFEKEAEEVDPFGLDQFLAEVKKKAKKGHG